MTDTRTRRSTALRGAWPAQETSQPALPGPSHRLTELLCRPRIGLGIGALLFATAAAVGFLVTNPPVGDFWAARARESAAAHGVALQYWFSWFGGTVPGHYSVLLPYLSRLISLAALGAAATVAIVGLSHLLLRGSRHPVIATWIAAGAASINLWSGRIPFAIGSALMLVTLLSVRHQRRWSAVLIAAVTALASPVSGAFLVLGLCGIAAHDRRRRTLALVTAAAATLCLGAVGHYFNAPGPEGFPALQAWFTAGAIAIMLLANPPPYIRTVLLVSLVACPVVALVPNGLGSNFERFTWLCLPVAVAATGRARLRITATVTMLAVAASMVGSAKDLYVATRPESSYSYVAGLVAQLDQTPRLADYRVEVVPDGTHVAAYALLGHAQQARGFETQSENAYDSVLESPSLDAASYLTWLKRNAVGYVAIDRHTLLRGPENDLVRSGRLSYLHLAWSDAHWQLFRVTAARPIVAAPAQIIDADQSNLVISAPHAGRLDLRVRWSRFLEVSGQQTPGGASVRPDGSGWTTLRVPARGQYIIS